MKKLSEPVIAVVGGTGVVGGEMLSILEEKNFPFKEVKVLASAHSAGEIYEFADQEIVVEELDKDSFEGVDLALFATSASLSEQYAPIAVEAGAIVIDNSSCFRMDPAIPLVVPEVNFDAIKSEHQIIANPNCSTIQLMPVLKAIHEKAGLKRVVVSTYQAVSGAGKAAMEELWEQVRSILSQQEVSKEVFSSQIAFNCIPHIDVFTEDSYTKEEVKVINESRKILNLPDLAITCTAVRVPVFNSHAESVNIETKDPLNAEECIELLDNTAGVKIARDSMQYPMQIDVSGSDDVYVGRVRNDRSVENGLNLWVVADNLRKGAALNAIQIAEKLLG